MYGNNPACWYLPLKTLYYYYYYYYLVLYEIRLCLDTMLKLRYITVVGRKSSVRRILPLKENLRKKKSYNKKKVKVLRSHPVSNFLPHCNIEIFSTFPNMAENGTVLTTFIHICIMYKYIYISYIAIMCRCTS